MGATDTLATGADGLRAYESLLFCASDVFCRTMQALSEGGGVPRLSSGDIIEDSIATMKAPLVSRTLTDLRIEPDKFT